MTKTISFGCKPTDQIYLEQILPALLNKTKCQTIRPAWIMLGKKELQAIQKGPRFKFGDPVKFYWKQRSQYKYFYKGNGHGTVWSQRETSPNSNKFIPNPGAFPKILGTGTITEVLKVVVELIDGTFFLTGLLQTNLAKRDGFNSANDMFIWLNNHYDLTTPKPFWVYRWDWD